MRRSVDYPEDQETKSKIISTKQKLNSSTSGSNQSSVKKDMLVNWSFKSFCEVTVMCACHSFHPQLTRYLLQRSLHLFNSRWTVLPKPWWWWWRCAGVRSDTVPWEPQTHFLYDYSDGKNAGDDNLWSWMIKKTNTFYRMIWCSITRRGHIKSQYLQIVLGNVSGTNLPLRAKKIPQRYACRLFVHTTVCWWWKRKVSIWGHYCSIRSLTCDEELSFQTADPSDNSDSSDDPSNCLTEGTKVTHPAIVHTVLLPTYAPIIVPIFSICTFCIQHKSIYLYFFFIVCKCVGFFFFLHSIFQSLDAYFGFKQWTAPMDREFALQIGSFSFPDALQKLKSFTVCFSVHLFLLSVLCFSTPYIYI